jgi:phospholipid/cholesterol/gamma-HCH transport system substrate-binding protein
MELRYRREAAVGAMIIAGAVVFVFLLMWLRGQRLREGEVVHVVINDVAGLRVGDPVRTSGVNVGQVQTIALRGPGNVDVSFDVARGPSPREDASAVVKSADLFGARYIDYTPGVSPRPLPRGREIRGVRPPDISEMAGELSLRSEGVLGNADTLARELRASLADVRRLLRTLNEGSAGTSAALIGSLEDLRHVLQRADLMVQQTTPALQESMRSAQRASANVDTLTATLSRTAGALDSLVARVNAGRGLAWTLVNDTSLVTELRQTNTALRDLLTDLKANPGRYFRLRL